LQLANLFSIKNNGTIGYNIYDIKFPKNINNYGMWLSNVLIFLLLIYLSSLLFTIIKIAINLNKNLLFTKKNSKQLYSVGIGTIVFTLLLIFIQVPLELSILINKTGPKETYSYYLGSAFGFIIAKRLYLFVIAIFILIISSLIKSGEIIQKENNLTI
jgi:hypothetical protein